MPLGVLGLRFHLPKLDFLYFFFGLFAEQREERFLFKLLAEDPVGHVFFDFLQLAAVHGFHFVNGVFIVDTVVAHDPGFFDGLGDDFAGGDLRMRDTNNFRKVYCEEVLPFADFLVVFVYFFINSFHRLKIQVLIVVLYIFIILLFKGLNILLQELYNFVQDFFEIKEKKIRLFDIIKQLSPYEHSDEGLLAEHPPLFIPASVAFHIVQSNKVY